jgi:hypothetical protein
MLNLLETVNAIKTLDTEPDTICQACQHIIAEGEGPISTPTDVAREIIRGFVDRVDTVDLMLASAMIAGRVGAIVAGGENEEDLARRLIDVFAREFTDASRKRRERAKEAKK